MDKFGAFKCHVFCFSLAPMDAGVYPWVLDNYMQYPVKFNYHVDYSYNPIKYMHASNEVCPAMPHNVTGYEKRDHFAHFTNFHFKTLIYLKP